MAKNMPRAHFYIRKHSRSGKKVSAYGRCRLSTSLLAPLHPFSLWYHVLVLSSPRRRVATHGYIAVRAARVSVSLKQITPPPNKPRARVLSDGPPGKRSWPSQAFLPAHFSSTTT